MGPLQQLLNKLAPFLMLGIALVAFAFGIIIFAYLFFFGAAVGLVLFVINWFRRKSFAQKSQKSADKKPSGRVIDSDDWKVL